MRYTFNVKGKALIYMQIYTCILVHNYKRKKQTNRLHQGGNQINSNELSPCMWKKLDYLIHTGNSLC